MVNIRARWRPIERVPGDNEEHFWVPPGRDTDQLSAAATFFMSAGGARELLHKLRKI